MIDTVFVITQETSVWHDSIANWLQGIGTLVAIAGLIIAWWSLKSDNKKQKVQLDALSLTVKSNAEVIKQLTELVRATKEIREIEKVQDKIKAKPDIRIRGNTSSSSHSDDWTIRYHPSYRIVNEGYDNALNVKIEINNSSNDFYIVDIERDKLANDGKDAIIMTFPSFHGVAQYSGLLIINYEDIYKNMYAITYQIIGKEGDIEFLKVSDEERTK